MLTLVLWALLLPLVSSGMHPSPSLESEQVASVQPVKDLNSAKGALHESAAILEKGGHGSSHALFGLQAQSKMDAIVRSLIAGLSTSIGAGVVLCLQGAPSASQMAFALALAAGVMLTVSVVELFGPALFAASHRLEALAAALLGLGSFLLLKHLVPEPELTGYKKDEDHSVDVECGEDAAQQEFKGRQWRLALILTLALTAHNFPEGLAVAVSSLQSDQLGFIVMAAIAVHNIPEGIAIAMPVLDATNSRWRAMQMATLSGLAEPLGAFVAVTFIPPELLKGRGMDILLCFVGGIMTSVALAELLPEAIAQRRPISCFLGLLAGAAVMLMTHELA